MKVLGVFLFISKIKPMIEFRCDKQNMCRYFPFVIFLQQFGILVRKWLKNPTQGLTALFLHIQVNADVQSHLTMGRYFHACRRWLFAFPKGAFCMKIRYLHKDTLERKPQLYAVNKYIWKEIGIYEDERYMRKIIIFRLCCGLLIGMVGCDGNTVQPPTESPPTAVSETASA